MRLRLTDVRDHSVRELDLSRISPDMPGWNGHVAGWSLGREGSGARIELDERLDECRIGIFHASNHVVLWGAAKELPEAWMPSQEASNRPLVPFQPEAWIRLDRKDIFDLGSKGDAWIRFDSMP